MAHPQSTPRGLFARKRIDTHDGSGNNFSLTADSSGHVFSGGIKISDSQGITANSTGLVFANSTSALPGSVDNGILLGMVSNSTGVAVMVNSTGTTHKFLNVTSKQPT